MLSVRPQKTFIRNVALHPLFFSLYNGTTNAASTASAGDRMQILKTVGVNKTAVFGDLRVSHSQAASNHKLTFDSSQASQVTVSATTDTIGWFRLELQLLSGQPSGFHEGLDHYRKEVAFETIIPANATQQQAVDALYQGILDYFATNELIENYFSYTYDNTTTPGVSVLTVTALDPRIKLTFYANGRQFSTDATANPIRSLKPTETNPPFEGLNTYANVLTERLQTEVTNEPYMGADTEVPRPGEAYTTISFTYNIPRGDLGGPAVVDQVVAEVGEMRLTLLETSGNKQWLTDVLTFLNGAGNPASSVTKVYTLPDGTPAASLAAFLAAW